MVCVLDAVAALNLAVSFGLQMVIILAAMVYVLAGFGRIRCFGEIANVR